MTTRPATTRHPRGTVMVMVVVVLVLMAMLGAAYMQVARVQRVAKTEPIDNIDLILQSIIDEIKLQMRRDVMSDTGQFFTPGSAAEDVFDYPRTNPTPTRQTPLINGTFASTARGGINDDTWLADTVPYDNGGTLSWRKITSLYGGFYNTDGAGSPPARNVVSSASNANPNTYVTTQYDNLALTNTALVDADYDGFGDSRWERAPIMVLTGTEYFMAVRIIDASSLINLFSATAPASSGSLDHAFAAFELRGNFPTEVDLARLCAKKVGASWTADCNALFTQRTNIAGIGSQVLGLSNPQPAGSFPFTWTNNSRIDYWMDRVSLYGDLRAEAVELTELHWRGGLNNPSVTTVTEGNMPTVLDDPWDDSQPTPIPDAGNHFLGTGGDDPANIGGKSYQSIRHLLTMLSGQAAFAPNHGNMHAGAHTLREDLVYNHVVTNPNPQSRANAFYERMRRVLNLPATGAGDNAAAAQLACAMVEYSDPDKVPTVSITAGGQTWYALEVLPMLREVYVQAGYQHDGAASAGGRNYNLVIGSEAAAVEIGNPFDRQFQPGGGLQVRAAFIQGGTTKTFDITESLNPRDPTGSSPGLEHRIYVVNPANAVNEGGVKNDLATNLAISPAPSNTVQPKTITGGPFTADGNAITVELQVNIGGSWVAYDRLTDSNLSLPASVNTADYTGGGAVPQAEATGHIQKSLRRDGAGIRYVHNGDKAIVNPRVHNPTAGTPWPSDGYQAASCQTLNNDNKSVTNSQAAALDRLQLPIANRSFFSVTEIGTLMAVGFNNATSGGTFPELLAATTPANWKLDITASKVVNNLNHAQIAFDQFTTLSPRHDGFDNDNDDYDNNPASGADNPEEQFIPGTINVNTMPYALLNFAIPLPELNTLRNPVAEAIFNRRVTDNGIRGIGRLLDMDSSDTTAGYAAANLKGVGQDAGHNAGTTYDLYPLNEVVTAAAPNNAVRLQVVDDHEELLARFQFLSQVLTTRSDVYIAHILAKGYTSGSFGSGAVETGRMIVVFSRAKLRQAGDEVEVLAAYKY